MHAKKKGGVKLAAVVLVMALLIGGAIGGTLAWLIAESDPVVNTFTVGNINIALDETTNVTDAQNNAIWQGKLVPGTDIAKDPVVTVESGSEACWLFVKVEESCTVPDYSFNNFVTYAIADGWNEVVTDQPYKLYAREVGASDEDQQFQVLTGAGDAELKDGYVSIPSDVTKAMMDQVTETNAPKLTFTAYAIQSENLNKDGVAVNNAAGAWAVYTNPPSEPNTNNS